MKRFLIALSACIPLLAWGADEMQASISNGGAYMTNGLVRLTIGSNGRATNLRVPSIANINFLASSGIYFDYTASANAGLTPDKAEVVKLTDDYAEVRFSNTKGDIRWSHGYIMRKDVQGVYCYVIAEGTPTSKSVSVREARVCTRVQSGFLDGYVDEVMQGKIPNNSVMADVEKNAQIQDATYRLPDGTIYTKYNWAQFIARDLFHGLMNGKSGIWNIPCSYEWLNGGPLRQELTVHATSKSPITIQMLQGEHLGGAAHTYADGDRQIFGPFLIYINSGDSRDEIIADARAMALRQQAEWPFQWFENELYPTDRATVKGRIRINTGGSPEGLTVVLADPAKEIIRQGGKYIYWGKTDADGNFSIPNVRKDEYSLHAYATGGSITEQFTKDAIAVDAAEVDLGVLDWAPVEYETLLWQIGESDRLADGFKGSDRPRAYGYWEDIPATLDYRVGSSVPSEDWWHAQAKNGTWTIRFNLHKEYEGDIHLTCSAAGTTNKPKVAIDVNGVKKTTWSFSNNDAAIYRSATLAGRHVVKTLTFPASALKVGENTIGLTMSGISKNGGVLWDCLKLEAGAPKPAAIIGVDADATDGVCEIYSPSGVKMGTFGSVDEARAALPGGIYICRTSSGVTKLAF